MILGGLKSYADNTIDSLQKALGKEKTDTGFLKLKINLGEAQHVSRLTYWDSLIVLGESKINASATNNYFYKKQLRNLTGQCYTIKAYVSQEQEQNTGLSIHCFKKAVQYFGQAINLALLAEAFNNLGYLYATQFDFKNAIKYYQKSISFKERLGDKNGVANTTSYLALEYENIGDTKKALELNHKSLKLREKLDNPKALAKSYNSIATIHAKQQNYELAQTYLLKAFEVNLKNNDSLAMATNLNNISFIQTESSLNFKKNKNFTAADSLRTLAKNNLLSSLTIQKILGYMPGVANCLNNLGLLYIEQIKEGQNKSKRDSLLKVCEQFHLEALKINTSLKNSDDLAHTCDNLASFYLFKKQYNEALKHGLQSYQLSIENQYPENIRNACSTLKKVYSALHKPTEALKMYETYIQMRDSLNSLDTQDEAKRQQFKYEWEKHEDEIKLTIEKKEAIATEEKKKQKIILYSVLLSLLIVIIFSILLFKRFKITRRQKTIIEEQRQNTEQAYHLLHEKNKEVIDSIHYAARIQRSLITSEKYIKKYLNK